MIGFYGIGGGWGHLTRIKSFIQHQKIAEPFKVITTHGKAEQFFAPINLIKVSADETTSRHALIQKLKEATGEKRFDALYVDAFPNGILGELNEVQSIANAWHYLARRLKWAAYQRQLPRKMAFGKVFVFESLEKPHQQFIKKSSQQIINVKLTYPNPQPIASHNLPETPFWLIVHTTSQVELEMLIEHAQDVANVICSKPHLVVLSDIDFHADNTTFLKGQNPIEWFPYADKIFSAAGFNTWYQIAPWREKHICLPFDRKFDDQFWRATNR